MEVTSLKARRTPKPRVFVFDLEPSARLAHALISATEVQAALISRAAAWLWLQEPEESELSYMLALATTGGGLARLREWATAAGVGFRELPIGGLRFERATPAPVRVDFIDKSTEGNLKRSLRVGGRVRDRNREHGSDRRRNAPARGP